MFFRKLGIRTTIDPWWVGGHLNPLSIITKKIHFPSISGKLHIFKKKRKKRENYRGEKKKAQVKKE